MLEVQSPIIITTVITAVIGSINPYTIGVLILVLSVLISDKKSSLHIFGLGMLYISSVFFVYLLAGLGLTHIFTSIPLTSTKYLSLGTGVLIIIAGIIEIKDFFWYGQSITLTTPVRYAKHIHTISNSATVPSVILLGMFVSVVGLPHTSMPYLAIITILSQGFNFTGFLLLVLYNIIFILPLIITLIIVVVGKKLHKIKIWKQNTKHYIRLATGLLLIAMGWLLMLIANGTINIG